MDKTDKLIDKLVYCVQLSMKHMFPLFEWEARNIRKQRKQFINQKIFDNIKESSSKQANATNFSVKDPKPQRHIEIKTPNHNF